MTSTPLNNHTDLTAVQRAELLLAIQQDPDDDTVAAMEDCLADLMHLCHHRDINFAAVLAVARSYVNDATEPTITIGGDEYYESDVEHYMRDAMPALPRRRS